MQADHTFTHAFDAQRVEKHTPSLVRAESGAPIEIPAQNLEHPLAALRPATQSLLDAHRPLAFLWQQGLIALAPLASLLGVELARPAHGATTRAQTQGHEIGDADALE